MTAQIIPFPRRPEPAAPAFRAVSLAAALWIAMGAVMLLWLPPSSSVAHISDLLLHAILLDRAGMPIVAEMQRTRAAIIEREFAL